MTTTTKSAEYVTHPLTGTVHLARPTGGDVKTLCGTYVEDPAIGDETLTGLAATCDRCRRAFAPQRPRLTSHQKNVYERIERRALLSRGPVPENQIGSHSGCWYLVRKGYVEVTTTYGPRGGAHYAYAPVGLAEKLAIRDRQRELERLAQDNSKRHVRLACGHDAVDRGRVVYCGICDDDVVVVAHYASGTRVSPIGQPDKHGVVIGDENGFPLVQWDEGVVAEGTPNPISEAPSDLQLYGIES